MKKTKIYLKHCLAKKCIDAAFWFGCSPSIVLNAAVIVAFKNAFFDDRELQAQIDKLTHAKEC